MGEEWRRRPFVEDLQHALGPSNTMPISELLNGVHRGRFPGPVDYRVLQDVLQCHDRRLALTPEGVEFQPITDASDMFAQTTPRQPQEDNPAVTAVTIQAERRDTRNSGCIRLVKFIKPQTTSPVLDALQQRVDTLKIVLNDGEITLHQILPTKS